MLKRIWPPSALQWATFVVIVYFAVVALAFHEIKPCNGAGGFIAALSCLEANEFGDLLAGLFAPLAFIGLGYAIYIQSQELRAQREELASTREVSEKSAAYLLKQAELAQIQTDILLSEDEKKAQAEADEQFDAALAEFATIMQRSFHKPIIFMIFGHAHLMGEDIEVVIDFLPHGRARWVAQPRDILSTIVRNGKDITKLEIMGYESHNVSESALSSAINLLKVAKEARRKSSAAKRLSVDRYRVGKAHQILKRIETLVADGAGAREG